MDGHDALGTLLPPPASLRDAVEAEIKRTAALLRPDAHGGLVATAMTVDGHTRVALAVVHRIGDHFEIGGYLGTGWGEPIAGGGSVKLQW